MPRTWRERLWRWRWWLGAAALLLAVRVALPYVLAAVIASQASEALHARVDVGDVDLRLWRGGVALEDVAVRPLDAPTPPPDATPLPEGAAAPAFDQYSPLIGFKRFAVEIRYLPLFSKIIQLRDIELVSPRVALERLADGELNLLALVPKSDVAVEAGATPAPTPASEDGGSAWGFGLDRFVLKDGRVRFVDLMMQGSEPVELGIDEIDVAEVALTPEVYGQPARIRVKLGLDEGVVDVDARLKLAGGDVAVTTDVSANRLPLRRARLYVPKVGWSELDGELDLAAKYELEPQAKNELSGTLALRDVAVKVPDAEDAAARWRSFAVDIERVDLLGQRAQIRSVALDGAAVRIHLGGGRVLLPLLEIAGRDDTAPPDEPPTPAATNGTPSTDATPPGAATPSEPTDAAPTATPTPAGADAATPAAAPGSPSPAAEADAPAEPAKPWEWLVAAIKITDSKIEAVTEKGQRDVGLTLDVTNLGGAPDTVAHVALGLTPPQGSLNVEGDLRLAAVPAFGGTLKIAELALPPLLEAVGTLPTETLQSGVLRADLTIAAGLPAAAGGAAAADRLSINGTLGLADLRTVPPRSGMDVAMKDLDLRIASFGVPGVIPPGQAAAAGSTLDVALQLALAEPHITRGGEAPLDLQLQSLTLEVPSLALPAAAAGLAPADGAPNLAVTATLELGAPRIALGAATILQAERVGLVITDASVPAPLAGVAGGEGTAQIVDANATLELGSPRIALDGEATVAAADRIALAITGASIPVLKAPAAAAPAPAVDGSTAAAAAPPAGAPPAPAAPPAKLSAQLDVAAAKLTTAQGKDLDAGVRTLGLQLTDVVVPGFVAGAAPGVSADPLRAAATLDVTDVRAARADGKEFSVAVKSIGVPLTELTVPGSIAALSGGAAPAGAANPMRLTFGEIRIAEPNIRVTRTKEGIVLPSGGAAPPAAARAGTPASTAPAAPAASPARAAASPAPIALQAAALKVSKGELEFTDRAVQPPFNARYDPIDIDLRNVQYPNLTVKPLTIAIANADGQGRIDAKGELAPGSGAVDLTITDFGLLAFNPYATTYAGYDIADGALTLKTTAKYRGGKYDVHNDITLHQFDLSSGEGDSAFEQQFGMPLSMALALLRDVGGDIDLGVPITVDEAGGTAIDFVSVVRSALRQALTGAITSPLKMLGAAAGLGKGGGSIAPAPIAFRTGQAQPTKKGGENSDRLAAFLASRPAMAVELKTAPTDADARWLHEQALRATWDDEGFFERSLAFVTERGPRQRIRAYLDARAADRRAELSPEDQAVLDQSLAEVPAPTAEQLGALASARLDAVDAVLRAKSIDAARITRVTPPDVPAEGKAAVSITFRPASRPPAAGS